ncbi:hypothetical protein [Flavobacterium covae]|uniref:hypothetical protein n=1 Tax=Flavobacterium covae TaxID=2906076 RepID=UPI003391278D
MQDDKGKESAIHEYYVTAYHDGTQRVVSGNVDFTNTKTPEQRRQETIDHLEGKTKENDKILGHRGVVPRGQPVATVQPQPAPAKKDISKVYITDASNKAITSTVKGGVIRVWIESTGLKGKPIRFKLYEQDITENQLIIDKKDTLVSDMCFIDVTLNKVSKSLGDDLFEGSEQEFFVNIEVLETHSHIKSVVVDVDVKALKQDVPTNVTKLKVEQADAPKDNKTVICFYKQNDLIWGNKVSCDFRKKVVQICVELWGESKKIEMANGLMTVMRVETRETFKANQLEGYKSLIPKEDMEIKHFRKNGKRKSSRAVGLIQFTQDALVALGEYKSNKSLSVEERFDELNRVKLKFAKMSELVQLDYVKKYFELGDAHKKFKSAEDIYLHVFAPKGVAKGDDFILYREGTDEYESNISIDTENNSDGKIQRKEILGRYKSSYSLGQSNKENNFTCISTPTIKTDSKGITTYHIFKEGRIEKQIPKQIKSGYERKYRYVYHDEDGTEHEICIFDFITAGVWEKGKKTKTKTGVWEKRIAEGKTRYFKKGNGTVELLKMKLPLNYTEGKVKIKLADNTTREYVNPKVFASIIGALAECAFDDVQMNGFTTSDGTGAPSVSHINGTAGDFRYLRKDKKLIGLEINNNPTELDVTRQEKFIEALVKFGYYT